MVFNCRTDHTLDLPFLDIKNSLSAVFFALSPYTNPLPLLYILLKRLHNNSTIVILTHTRQLLCHFDIINQLKTDEMSEYQPWH